VIRAIRCTPLLLLVLAFAADAAAPITTTKPFSRPAPDQVDYLFLASDRPILIRIHLRALGDKPYGAVQEAFFDKLFAWFDVNNDGFLSKEEAGRLMTQQGLYNLMIGGFGGGDNQVAPFAALDRDKDGKVSKEEFHAYYRSGGGPQVYAAPPTVDGVAAATPTMAAPSMAIPALRFSTDSSRAQKSKQLNDALYRRLGRAETGKLTKADVLKLPGLMARLDEDEDEYLTASEINTEDGGGLYDEVFVGRRFMGGEQNSTGIVEIQKTTTAASLVAAVMGKFDKNKDGKLTPGENGLDKAFVTALDTNKDGVLDAREVEAYFYGQPDVVLRARVGPRGTGLMPLVEKTGWFGTKPRAEILDAAKLPASLSKKVKSIDADSVSLDLGDARIAVQAIEGSQVGQLEGAKSFFVQLFDGLADKEGYVMARKDKDKNNNNDQAGRFVYGMFKQADKNNDGKLHRSEYVGWLDLMNEGNVAFVGVTVSDGGRSLFELLDTDRDNKLSIQELRAAWGRIEPLCSKGEGLAQAGLPRSLRITLSQGNAVSVNRFNFFGTGQQPLPARKAKRVPEWFTKLDLNNDGVVSPREWLGSRETFDEIDTDKDGLISAEEAEAYDKKKREKEKE